MIRTSKTVILTASIAVSSSSAQAQQDLVASETTSVLLDFITNSRGALPGFIRNYFPDGCGDFNVLPEQSIRDVSFAACIDDQNFVGMSSDFPKRLCNLETCSDPGSLSAPAKVALAQYSLWMIGHDASGDRESCGSLAGPSLETLRLLYSGDGSGSYASCDSQRRRALVRDLSSLLADCASECSDGRLSHAFRPGDDSEYTRVFMDLVGISSFCNGDQNSDLDPIRRECTKEDHICGHDGKLGLVLPIVIDEESPFEDEEVNNNTRCGIQTFAYAAAPLTVNPILDCPYGPPRNAIAGNCAYPVDRSGFYGCLAATGIPNRPALANNDRDFDPREFNLIARSYTGRIAVDMRAVSNGSNTYKGSPFYRLSKNCAQGRDSMDQISCLVNEVPCSVGWGSKGVESYSSLETPSREIRPGLIWINGKAPNETGYALNYKLYLKSMKGFVPSALSEDERRLTQCLFSQTLTERLGGKTLLQYAASQLGYQPLPSTESQAHTAVTACP